MVLNGVYNGPITEGRNTLSLRAYQMQTYNTYSVDLHEIFSMSFTFIYEQYGIATEQHPEK